MSQSHPPFAYLLHSSRDRTILAVAPTLQAVSRKACNRTLGCYISAWWLDGTIEIVPRTAYMQPNPPSQEEALEFIRARQQARDVAIAQGRDGSLVALRGWARCNIDDPEQQQISDYIATAPWSVRGIVAETWWAEERVNIGL